MTGKHNQQHNIVRQQNPKQQTLLHATLIKPAVTDKQPHCDSHPQIWPHATMSTNAKDKKIIQNQSTIPVICLELQHCTQGVLNLCVTQTGHDSKKRNRKGKKRQEKGRKEEKRKHKNITPSMWFHEKPGVIPGCPKVTISIRHNPSAVNYTYIACPLVLPTKPWLVTVALLRLLCDRTTLGLRCSMMVHTHLYPHGPVVNINVETDIQNQTCTNPAIAPLACNNSSCHAPILGLAICILGRNYWFHGGGCCILMGACK